jgi:hypothetical protein
MVAVSGLVRLLRTRTLWYRLLLGILFIVLLATRWVQKLGPHAATW